MKNLLTTLLLVLVVSVASFAQGNGNGANNQMINKARQAAKSCIQNAMEPHYEIEAQVNVVSACFASGFITEVTFHKVRKCTQSPCPKPYAQLVAKVTIGCNGDVMNTVCGF